MGGQVRTVEAVAERLASAQWGVVTRAQLIEEGVTGREIEHRLKTRALLPAHRGVYRVGHRAPSVEAMYLAACWPAGRARC